MVKPISQKEIDYVILHIEDSLESIAEALDRGVETIRLLVKKYETEEQKTARLKKSSELRSQIGRKSGLIKSALFRNNAEQMAERLFTEYSNDPFFIHGLCLYWAEGAKRDFAFSNSDPEMMIVFHEWINRFFPENEQVLVIRKPENISDEEISSYWHNIFPNMRSYKPTVSKLTKTKYGVVSIDIRGVSSDKIFIQKLMALLKDHMKMYL